MLNPIQIFQSFHESLRSTFVPIILLTASKMQSLHPSVTSCHQFQNKVLILKVNAIPTSTASILSQLTEYTSMHSDEWLSWRPQEKNQSSMHPALATTQDLISGKDTYKLVLVCTCTWLLYGIFTLDSWPWLVLRPLFLTQIVGIFSSSILELSSVLPLNTV